MEFIKTLLSASDALGGLLSTVRKLLLDGFRQVAKKMAVGVSLVVVLLVCWGGHWTHEQGSK